MNKKVVYNANNKRPSDKKAAKNEFQYAKGNVTYLSRKDNFANFDKATAAPKPQALSQKVTNNATIVANKNYGTAPKATGKMPAQKQKNGVELSDLRGKSYDDPMWNKLLSQMSVKDLGKVITYGGYQTFRIPSVKKVEIEELILSKNTLENNVIKLEKIEKICDELFENELAGNGKTWQREGIDILLTKLGIDRINNFC